MGSGYLLRDREVPSYRLRAHVVDDVEHVYDRVIVLGAAKNRHEKQLGQPQSA